MSPSVVGEMFILLLHALFVGSTLRKHKIIAFSALSELHLYIAGNRCWDSEIKASLVPEKVILQSGFKHLFSPFNRMLFDGQFLRRSQKKLLPNGEKVKIVET